MYTVDTGDVGNWNVCALKAGLAWMFKQVPEADTGYKLCVKVLVDSYSPNRERRRG